MKKNLIKALLIIVAIALPLVALRAASENGAVLVSSDEVITGNLIAAGETVIVEGTISGDLITISKSITVSGRVEGDIIALAQNIDISGEVGGNIRVAGTNININSVITRNLNAFGSQVLVGDEARIGWDSLLGGANVRIKGNTDGSLDVYAQNASLAGKIGKNARFYIFNNQTSGLAISKDAVINGDLNYSAKTPGSIDRQANISGQTNYKEFHENTENHWAAWAWSRLFALLSTLLIGLIFVFVLPKNTRNILEKIKTTIGKATLSGALVVLLVPVATLILLFTIIGLPLAFSLLGLWLGLLFFGKALAAIVIGNLILQDLFKISAASLFWPLLLGVFLLSLLFTVPFIGWIINLFVIFVGVGTIINYVNNQSKNI